MYIPPTTRARIVKSIVRKYGKMPTGWIRKCLLFDNKDDVATY